MYTEKHINHVKLGHKFSMGSESHMNFLNNQFYPLFNAYNLVQFQKKLTKRFKENFRSSDFELSHDTITSFQA